MKPASEGEAQTRNGQDAAYADLTGSSVNIAGSSIDLTGSAVDLKAFGSVS